MTTMNRRAILLVCAVLAVLAVLDAAGPQKKPFKPFEPFKHEYLDWRDTPKEFEDKKKATRNVIRSIGIQDGDGAEDILEKMQAISTKFSKNSREGEVYAELVSYPTYTYCLSYVSLRVLDICSLMYEDDSIANFAPFLVEYGGKICKNCRESPSNTIPIQPDSPMREGEASLGEFFAVLLGLEDPKLDDSSWMLEEVKKLDLLERDDLNVGLAVEHVKELGNSKSSDSFVIFDGFLSAECSKLKEELGTAMNSVALDIAFNNSAQFYDARVLKLLEFTRVCLSWRRQDMRAAAVKNIKNHLREPIGLNSWKPWKSGMFRARRSENRGKAPLIYTRIN